MSTTPQPRPVSPKSSRRERRRDVTKTTFTRSARSQEPKPAPETSRERLRYYLPYIAAPNLALVLGVVALCFAVILIGGWRLAYLPAAIGESWFALHGAPIAIDGVLLTAMPALPAVGVAAFIAARVRAATAGRVSILDLCTLLGLTVAFSLTLSAVALFMVHDASMVFTVETPPVGAALAYPVLVHLIGYILGIRKVLWHALARRAGIPTEAVDAGVAAGSLCGRLVLAACAVFLVALAFGYARVGELVAQFPNVGFAGGAVLVLLCVLYLPNAAIATLAVLLGGSFEYGGDTVSLFNTGNVVLPPLPLFAAIPSEMPAWAPVLLIVPAAVLLHGFVSRELTYTGIVAAATWAALVGAVGGVFTAGVAGAYGLVGANPWTLALLAFVWVAVAGVIVRVVAKVRQRAHSRDA